MKEFSEDEVIAAIDSGDPVEVRRAIERVGVNYRLEKEDGDPLINFAIADAESEIFTEILAHDPDLELRNDLGETILHSAVFSGVEQRVRKVFSQKLIDIQRHDGTTPLLLAIGLKHEQLALFLIEKGADINMADEDGNRPIHLASFFGLYKVVGALLARGVEVKVKTGKGNYPLSLAINNDFYEIARMLLACHDGLEK